MIRFDSQARQEGIYCCIRMDTECEVGLNLRYLFRNVDWFVEHWP